jgi:hypothetical protein
VLYPWGYFVASTLIPTGVFLVEASSCWSPQGGQIIAGDDGVGFQPKARAEASHRVLGPAAPMLGPAIGDCDLPHGRDGWHIEAKLGLL